MYDVITVLACDRAQCRSTPRDDEQREEFTRQHLVAVCPASRVLRSPTSVLKRQRSDINMNEDADANAGEMNNNDGNVVRGCFRKMKTNY